MNPWDHQTKGVDAVLAAIGRGVRRIALTSPTGGGKTRMMEMLVQATISQGGTALLYTNRKMLVDQTSGAMNAAGIRHGILAAGYDRSPGLPFQIASIQTEHSRAIKRQERDLFRANLVLVDEGHLHAGPTSRTILERHHEQGAAYVLVTATPFGLDAACDELIVAGTPSELRACGALIPALHHAPDEPDMRRFKKLREGEDLSEKQNKEAIMRPGIWGRVWDWFERLNPDHKPTILFAPGVAESIWFAQQFTANGCRAAHIDGQDVWLDGRLHSTSRALRQEVLEGSKDGSIVVLCNRFVLREGIDAPWLAHGILACVFGGLQSYLQSGGRLLRKAPGKDCVTIQDHGGAWHRHGSLNADREWHLSLTEQSAYDLRADGLRNKTCRKCGAPTNGAAICPACYTPNEKPPACCPICRAILTGRVCRCGYAGDKRARQVVQADGSLREMTCDVFRPRRISTKPNGAQLWERMYHRSRTKAGDRTFRAAAALFAAENEWGYPDPAWPFMPTDPMDWSRKVADVPLERLTAGGNSQ